MWVEGFSAVPFVECGPFVDILAGGRHEELTSTEGFSGFFGSPLYDCTVPV